jgi:hypothetical protein
MRWLLFAKGNFQHIRVCAHCKYEVQLWPPPGKVVRLDTKIAPNYTASLLTHCVGTIWSRP